MVSKRYRSTFTLWW